MISLTEWACYQGYKMQMIFDNSSREVRSDPDNKRTV